MIKSTIVSNRLYPTYAVYSNINFKTATIIFRDTWSITYGQNSNKKDGFKSYQECIDYLTSKGW